MWPASRRGSATGEGGPAGGDEEAGDEDSSTGAAHVRKGKG